MSQINELDKDTLDKFITKTLEKQMQSYIEGRANKALIDKHRKYISMAHDKLEKKSKSELGKIFGESELVFRKKPKLLLRHKKRLKMEENEGAPTNSMGASSSTQGPIQTFDPLLKLKKILKRKKGV